MQFLRQEAHSLKEELKIARMVSLILVLVKYIVRTKELFFTRTVHVCPRKTIDSC